MKRSFDLPSRWSPLLFAFGLALALHALLLSYLHLKRSRQIPEPSLQSKDNSPELLQFSSQPTPLISLDRLSLPKASVLPPPPANLLAPLQPSRAGGKKGSLPAASSAKTHRPLPVGQASRQLAQQKRPSLRPRGSATLALSSLALEDWNLALKQLRAAHEPLDSPSGAKDEDTLPPVLSGLEASRREAYLALWGRALPQLIPPSLKSLAQEGSPVIEVRRLPLEQSQTDELEVQHRQMLDLGDQLLLFWVEGKQLWLFRSMRDPASPT